MGPVDLHETQLRGPPAEPDLLSLNATATAAMIVAIALQIETPIGHSSKPAADWRKKSGVMHTSAILHFPPLWAISSTTSSLTLLLPRGEILPRHPFFTAPNFSRPLPAPIAAAPFRWLIRRRSGLTSRISHSSWLAIFTREKIARYLSFFSLLTTSSRKTPLS